MKDFSPDVGRASLLSRPIKVLFTGFCVFSVAGILSCVALYDGIVRFGVNATPQELYGNLVGYYQPGGAGYRRLLEVTHFHLFSMPILLLVVGHLYFMCNVSFRARMGWTVASLAFTAVHLAAPWAIVLAGKAVAWIFPISGAGLLVTVAVMIGTCLYEMWWRHPAARGVSAAGRSAIPVQDRVSG
jgi:hypothetical protein